MSNRLQLVTFDRRDYSQLIDWIPDEAFLLLWGGPLYDWPLTDVQIDRHLADDAVTAMLLLKDDEAIGFCELILESTGHYRLCRVLVGPKSLRGLGFGKRLVKLAIDHARDRLSAVRLALFVFEDNLPALGLYSSLGFEVVSSDQQGGSDNGSSRIVLRMERKL